MLHQFTWQQFLLAALIFTACWYAVIFLLYYRDKITGLFNGGKAKQPEKIKREWEEELEDDDPQDEEQSLVGRQQLPEGVSEVEMHMLGFAPKVKSEILAKQGETAEVQANGEPQESEAEPDADEYRDTEIGLVPDVLEELKNIFHMLETQDGTKEDFISLFSFVSSKYPKIKGTPNQQALNDHIRENLPFDISDEELDQLWV